MRPRHEVGLANYKYTFRTYVESRGYSSG